jgi:hypothetical protein
VTKQKEVAGYIIWRVSHIGNPVGFGSGNFLSRSSGTVSSCIVHVQTDASKRLTALAVAEVLLDIRKKRRAK